MNIEAIICPNCKKAILKKRFIIEGRINKETIFDCPKCVYFWTLGWFRMFNHFEHLILRKDKDIEKYLEAKEKWQKHLL